MNPVDRRPGGPRLLFLATDLASGGGVNRVIRDLAVLLRGRLGAQVRVVNARSDRGSTYEFPREIAVESHRRQSLPSYFLLLLRLRRSRPDVVISSWTQDNILVALAFLFSRSRVVLVEHSSWDFHALPIRVLRRLTYPLASALVVLNRRDLDHFRRSLRNVRLIPNPVAVPPARAEAREKLILAIGHLEPLKQFDHAISAMAASGLEDEGWSLAIIGTGSEAPHLTKLIAELGLTRTSVHASVDDLSSWYARASLLLITSRLESFSLVLAEAMAAGVVPIAYASDGPSFILEDFPDHLVPVGDGAALAKRLAQLANDVQLEELRPKLRASIEKRFSPEVIADCWQDLLGG
jgi:glycosyltransferase involved in cell wall biosynthesis